MIGFLTLIFGGVADIKHANFTCIRS